VSCLFGLSLFCLGFSSSFAGETVEGTRLGLYCAGSAGQRFALNSKATGVVYTGRMGYAFSRVFSLGLRFITGNEDFLDGPPALETTMRAQLGGGGVELKVTPFAHHVLIPSIAVGYDLSTILGGGVPTFDGHGFHAEIALDWMFSSHFSAGISVVYTRTWYKARGDVPPLPASFTDNRGGGEVSLAFYPNLGL
jgi:hypothetical protein